MTDPTQDTDLTQPFGYVYVLTNPAMPGIVKLGCTGKQDVTVRKDQLFTTGVPLPFSLEFACRVQNFKEVELALHTAFQPHRVSPNREFFEITPQQAIAILKLLHVEDVTAEIAVETGTVPETDKAAAEAFTARRPVMNFHEMGIPNGSLLTFSDEATTATVVGPKKVLFNGEAISLTAATQQIKGLPYAVQPSPYWTFGGKVLKAIYDETYSYVS
jgi:hypothetical protein